MAIRSFGFSAVAAGVRYPDRLDIGLIHAESPCVTAGVFTTNQVKAAPVIIDMERLQKKEAQTIIVNSGCANACTGELGMETAQRISRLVASRLGIDDEQVLVASTGVIGEQLPMAAFDSSIKDLVEGLAPDRMEDVAKAIMTTDTVHKMATRTCRLGGEDITITGMAKGAGMIMPDMATMLSFLFTDAAIGKTALQQALVSAVDLTFNRLSIDGDTSTNDTVLLMASGEAKNQSLEAKDPDFNVFQAVLTELCKDLALQIVKDGEGVTKTITITVEGAASDEDANRLAKAIAISSLVKTAFFGEDANWGRILMAMGNSRAVFDPGGVDLYFGDILLVEKGLGLGPDAEQKATEVLCKSDIRLRIVLREGSGAASYYTSDLSLDYVRINADYRS